MATETSPLLTPAFVGYADDDGGLTLTPLPPNGPVSDLKLAPPLTVSKTDYGTWQLHDTTGLICDATSTKNDSTYFEVKLKSEKKCVIEVVPKIEKASQWRWPLNLFF